MLTRIAAAAVLIGATILLIEVAPAEVFCGAATVLTMLAMREWSLLLKAYRLRIYPTTYLLTAAIPSVWLLFPESLALLGAASVVATIAWSVADATDVPGKLSAACANIASVLYLGVPFGILTFYQGDARLLWMILLVVWAGDSAALFVGKAWGRRKVTAISPNKTAEGFAGAVVGSVLGGIIAGYLFAVPGSPLYWATAGIVIGAAAIFGDLFESAVKRGAGVKDSSGLIPGHGGILDRIDSLLLAAPAFFLLDRLLQ